MHQTCVQILDSPCDVGPRAAEFRDTNEKVESHLGGWEKDKVLLSHSLEGEGLARDFPSSSPAYDPSFSDWPES